MGNYAEAMKNHKAALSFGKDVGDANVMALAFDGMAEVHKMRSENPMALSNYLSSAELFKKYSNRRDLARIYCRIGDCYRAEKNYELAKEYYSNAFALSKELKSIELLADYYRGVEMLDSAMGNWKEAYIDHKNYVQKRDSVDSKENTKSIVQLQLNYEFNKKEAATKAEQDEKDSRQRRQFISLSSIAALILILAIVLYRSQTQKARTNLQLKLKTESLREENRQKTSILNIVSHDLKAPFSKIKGLADLMRMTTDLSKKDKEEYLTHIQSAVDQGNHLISNLLESQTIHRETNKPFLEEIDFVKFLRDFQMDVNGQLLKKNQQLQTQINLRSDRAFTDQKMLTRILDNLVSNASKFSDQGKSIYLRAWSDSFQLNFSVRDEGPGISEGDQKRMFKKFQMLTARPTGGEGSTGLGLSITKALVEKLNGSIRVNSKLGEGTEVVISFPF
jgi:signal transduction histidine kinase